MKVATTLSAIVLASYLVASQAADNRIEPPPEGKAVVYIGRLTAFVGGGRPFHFFEGENYLVRIKGQNYIRYVCDPGPQVFWASAENRSFVKADLEAGRVYALLARLQAGTWSARVELVPLTRQSRDWPEFEDTIEDKSPDDIDPEYVAEWTRGHPDYIAKALGEWRSAGEPALTLRADEFID